jgi:hypothetical protein
MALTEEGAKNFNPIHDGFSTGFDRTYTLVGCRRCGAAVPEKDAYLAAHEQFHTSLLQFMQHVQEAMSK